MRLIPFQLANGTMIAVNPERVDAIIQIGKTTEIYCGEFSKQVPLPFNTVFAVLQVTEDKDGEQE